MFDTRSFTQKLKSRKLFVLALQWIIGACAIQYATAHPEYSDLIKWALGFFGITGSVYHFSQAHEDASGNTSPLGNTQAVSGDVTVNEAPKPVVIS